MGKGEKMKFRKKPVVVEAVQWTGENKDEISSFIWHDKTQDEKTHYFDEKGLHIITLEGEHFANVNDWIIKGVKGEFYPCKPDIFEATYEPVE